MPHAFHARRTVFPTRMDAAVAMPSRQHRRFDASAEIALNQNDYRQLVIANTEIIAEK